MLAGGQTGDSKSVQSHGLETHRVCSPNSVIFCDPAQYWMPETQMNQSWSPPARLVFRQDQAETQGPRKRVGSSALGRTPSRDCLHAGDAQLGPQGPSAWQEQGMCEAQVGSLEVGLG